MGSRGHRKLKLRKVWLVKNSETVNSMDRTTSYQPFAPPEHLALPSPKQSLRLLVNKHPHTPTNIDRQASRHTDGHKRKCITSCCLPWTAGCIVKLTYTYNPGFSQLSLWQGKGRATIVHTHACIHGTPLLYTDHSEQNLAATENSLHTV